MDIAITLIAIVGSLGGVWLGSTLGRRTALAERKTVRKDDLVKEASSVLRGARVAISALGPDGYALWASSETYSEIDKRRDEADVLRPQLAALAVQWPEGSDELGALERYLSNAPTSLALLVQAVLEHDDFRPMLEEAKSARAVAVTTLESAIAKLHDFQG